MAAVGGDNDNVTDVGMVQLNTVASITAAGWWYDISNIPSAEQGIFQRIKHKIVTVVKEVRKQTFTTGQLNVAFKEGYTGQAETANCRLLMNLMHAETT